MIIALYGAATGARERALLIVQRARVICTVTQL
jgi:hypothetical protein